MLGLLQQRAAAGTRLVKVSTAAGAAFGVNQTTNSFEINELMVV
jgi:hypothetical protein